MVLLLLKHQISWEFSGLEFSGKFPATPVQEKEKFYSLGLCVYLLGPFKVCGGSSIIYGLEVAKG